ncbi:MAG: hypothetical protein ACTSRU_20075 [Candidatus Hodarchaeales archaeon]
MRYHIYITLDIEKDDLKGSLQKFLSSQIKKSAEMILAEKSDTDILSSNGKKIGHLLITEEDVDGIDVSFEYDTDLEEEVIKEEDKRQIDEFLDNIN